MINLIKDLEEAKKELEDVNRKYERLAKTLPAILFEYVLRPKGKGKCIYVSPKCEEFFGISEKFFLKNLNNFYKLVHREDLPKLIEMNKESKEYSVEIRIFILNGQEKWIRFSSCPSNDFYDGQRIWSGLIFDITDKKCVEERNFHYATIDSLTEIYNRRYFYEKVKSEIETFKMTRKKFSILLLDLDRFKCINDKYGHIIGDEVLKHFVKETNKFLRPQDYFGRIGGEEFCVLFNETGLEEAHEISLKCRDVIENTPISTDLGEIYLTISGGLVEVDEEIEDVLPLIEKADKALYMAKDKGRNRIVTLEY